MGSLLETLITFVGTILVFALAAQSIQEMLKSIFAIKGRTMQSAIEGLVRESTTAVGQAPADADAILVQVTARLRALGQGGIRPNRIRLDTLPAAQLQELIAKVEPHAVPGLPAEHAKAIGILAAIGRQARDWYPLAIAPVDERYRRRMRMLAFFTSAVVVIPFNLDATRIFRLAETRPGLRAQVVAIAAHADSAYRGLPTKTAGSVASQSDLQQIGRVFNEDLLGCFTLAKLKQPRWWLGILFSIVLVSMGAPFWDDLLESLFGLKSRVVAAGRAANT